MAMGEGQRAEIGIIGGSGLYRFLSDTAPEFREVPVETPWGHPSGTISLAEVGGRRVAFLPRHGPTHTVPPHRINYRANIWALHSLGVARVLAPCAVGSLRPELPGGSVVIADQFINLTHGRHDTFFDGPGVAHLSPSEPYCRQLASLAASIVPSTGLGVRPGGTVVVINGPRFSTRAESRLFSSWGGDVINMTQYPEVVLAREMGMCYLNLSLVTDHDAGVEANPDVAPVTQEAVMQVFSQSTSAIRDALLRLIEVVPADRNCDCAAAPQPLSH